MTNNNQSMFTVVSDIITQAFEELFSFCCIHRPGRSISARCEEIKQLREKVAAVEAQAEAQANLINSQQKRIQSAQWNLEEAQLVAEANRARRLQQTATVEKRRPKSLSERIKSQVIEVESSAIAVAFAKDLTNAAQ